MNKALPTSTGTICGKINSESNFALHLQTLSLCFSRRSRRCSSFTFCPFIGDHCYVCCFSIYSGQEAAQSTTQHVTDVSVGF